MKKIKARTFDYSPIALRALSRHKLPPPAFAMKDKKHAGNKSFCRRKDDQ